MHFHSFLHVRALLPFSASSFQNGFYFRVETCRKIKMTGFNSMNETLLVIPPQCSNDLPTLIIRSPLLSGPSKSRLTNCWRAELLDHLKNNKIEHEVSNYLNLDNKVSLDFLNKVNKN